MNDEILKNETVFDDEYNGDDLAVVLERSEEFYKIANELSDYIKGLPLSKKQNDRLVELMLEQVRVAEHDASLQGANLMAKLMRHFQE